MKKQKDSQKVQPILVYTDFTSTGDKAVEWARFLCRVMNRRLILLHAIDNNTYTMAGDNDVFTFTREKLNDLKGQIEISHDAKVNIHIEEGCNCTIISRVSETEDVIFSVVGVHGKNDPQFLSGRTIVKAARRSRIPFLFVQYATPSPDALNKIAFPLNIQKKMKEKVAWGIFLSKHVHNEIEIITPVNDEDIKNNLLFTIKLFQQMELVFRQTKIGANILNIESKSIQYASKNGFLLSVLLLTKGSFLSEYFLARTNYVMCATNENMLFL